MADISTVTTTRSWGERIKGAIAGFFIGPVLIIGSVVLLWSNETNSVQTAIGLKEGASSVVTMASSPIDPSLEGKLIHTTGRASTIETLHDNLIGVSEPAIALTRKVEVYQWQEKSSSTSTDNYGGSQTTTTTYSYTKDWSDDRIDSSRFHTPAGHENPNFWKYPQYTVLASEVKVGDVRLSEVFVEQIVPTRMLSLSGRNLSLSGAINMSNALYIGKNPGAPEIGDTRIQFFVARPQEVSVIGKLSSGLLDTYMTKNNSRIALLESGVVGPEAMFQNAQDANALLTWILRVVGLVLMLIGFSLIFQLLVILAKVIPPLATFLGFGTGLLAFLLTLIVGGLTIAIAWLFARPILSGIILAVIIGGAYYIHQRKHGQTLTTPVSDIDQAK